MNIQTSITTVQGVTTASFLLNSGLLTAGEREIIVQRGPLRIDIGGTFTADAPSTLTFDLPLTTVDLPHCMPVQKVFDGADYGFAEAHEAATLWLTTVKARIVAAYTALLALDIGANSSVIEQLPVPSPI